MPFTIDDLNYDKDSKERMPWEHYLELYAKADPKEIASRLSIPYDEEAKEFTLTFLGSEYKITYPGGYDLRKDSYHSFSVKWFRLCGDWQV